MWRFASRSSAYFVERYPGCRSWATISGATSKSRSKCATPSSNARSVSALRGSPMWCETQARAPLVRQNVLLSSAPQAWIGGAASGSAIPEGTYPRERRNVSDEPPPITRTTESSVRVRIGRSCSSTRSAIPVNRASASSSSKAIGSSETLPLVITRGTLMSASSRWCSGVYGSITPSSRARGATVSVTAAPGLRGASTIGRSRERSSRSSSAPSTTSSAAAATSRTISANGLSSRCLRARSVATARSSAATHARWNPPSPLIATTPPPRRQPSTTLNGV